MKWSFINVIVFNLETVPIKIIRELRAHMAFYLEKYLRQRRPVT